MERFDDVAAGTRDLRITIGKGNIELRIAQGAGWSLDYDEPKGEALEVERDGESLRMRQRRGGRLDVRLTAPPELERIELHTGSGRIEVEGMQGRAHLTSGSGAVTLRNAGGSGG